MTQFQGYKLSRGTNARVICIVLESQGQQNLWEIMKDHPFSTLVQLLQLRHVYLETFQFSYQTTIKS